MKSVLPTGLEECELRTACSLKNSMWPAVHLKLNFVVMSEISVPSYSSRVNDQ